MDEGVLYRNGAVSIRCPNKEDKKDQLLYRDGVRYVLIIKLHKTYIMEGLDDISKRDEEGVKNYLKFNHDGLLKILSDTGIKISEIKTAFEKVVEEEERRTHI